MGFNFGFLMGYESSRLCFSPNVLCFLIADSRSAWWVGLRMAEEMDVNVGWVTREREGKNESGRRGKDGEE